MARRPSSTARRRARLAFRVDRIEQCESRTLATESLGVLLPSLDLLSDLQPWSGEIAPALSEEWTSSEEIVPTLYDEWMSSEDMMPAGESQPDVTPTEPRPDGAPNTTPADPDADAGDGASRGTVTFAGAWTDARGGMPPGPPTSVMTTNEEPWYFPSSGGVTNYKTMAWYRLGPIYPKHTPFDSSRVGIKTGSIHVTTSKPEYPIGQLVGSFGAKTCIGVIISSSDRTEIVVYHFGTTDSPNATLSRDVHSSFKGGAHVALFGGDNSVESNNTLSEVVTFLEGAKDTFDLKIDGYADTDGLWFLHGQYFTNGADGASQNEPSPTQ